MRRRILLRRRPGSLRPRCLVTGGAGFVGAALTTRLRGLGYPVRILELPSSPFLTVARTDPAVEVVTGDVADADDVRRAVSGIDAVFHVAALVDSIAPRPVFERVNVRGTEHVCGACVTEGVDRLVYVSTSDVFGVPPPGDDGILTETSPLRPWSEPYADTKIEATRIVRRYREAHGLRATVLYPGWIYGPGDRRLVPTVAAIARRGTLDVWHRTRPPVLALCYVDDLTDAAVRVLHDPTCSGEDFLVLDDDSGVTVEDFARFFAERQGVDLHVRHVPYPVMLALAWASETAARLGLIARPLVSTTDVKAFGHAFRFSSAKARTRLGWAPSLSSREGMARAWDWYRAQDPATLLGR